MYAKLENGKPKFLETPYVFGEYTIYGDVDESKIPDGFKPYIEDELPDLKEFYELKFDYLDNGAEIHKTVSLVKEPMPDKETETVRRIRMRYSENDEYSILRRSIAGNSENFAEYNAYVEQCSDDAQNLISRWESS